MVLKVGHKVPEGSRLIYVLNRRHDDEMVEVDE